jgi:hypothetical protein
MEYEGLAVSSVFTTANLCACLGGKGESGVSLI